MSLSRGRFYLLGLVIFALSTTAFSAKLSPHFYDKKCPDALATIKSVVDSAVKKDLRMGASLLRLHFHDCFVMGCDASVLLDQTPTIDSEKTAVPNINSLRGFDVVDTIKAKVDKACGGTVVSCADILAVAARDSVVALGGTTWNVPLGRRDSTNASRTLANANLPSPFLNLPGLLANFKFQGLNLRDLVALSGGHTVGVARCLTFRDRIYNNQSNTIDPSFAHQLQRNCPKTGGDANLSPLDSTPTDFDTKYFSNLIHKKGLLDSDQALFDGGATEGLVKKYTKNPDLFSKDFERSMIKMGNINVLTGKKGQIRGNCRVVN